MRSPFFFVVKPLDNTRYVYERNGLIVSTSEEDFKNSNRQAVVCEVPNNYDGPICEGDLLLVHHNVFKYYNDVKGRKKSGRSFLRDGYFYVDETQFYMYKKPDGWHTIGDFCFVKPSPKKDYFLNKSGDNEPLVGIVKYSNRELEDLGVYSGDEVCFRPGSEYEFFLDGETIYRMRTRSIVAKL